MNNQGTVVTTHKATFVANKFSPGYSGFLPDLRHQYGETYGRATTRHFYTERARALNLAPRHQSEKVNYKPTIRRHSEPGIPPCLNQTNYEILNSSNHPINTNQNQVVNMKNLYAKNAHLFTSKHGTGSQTTRPSFNKRRAYELDDLMSKCQDHRKAYKDISGCTANVKYFVVPKYFGQENRVSSYTNICDNLHGISNHVQKDRLSRLRWTYRSSNRERAMRDLHFEKR